ncbi:TonB-dependent receptor, partial [Methyloglobulus sp.]|uniref:TonB-dependent receptor domain-containing protein n=1 Tax=Methyloglobulus sp. TaxID=2518622 RepID=UPI0032B7D80A
MRYLLILSLVLFSPLSWSEEDVVGKNCPSKYGAKLVSIQGKLFFDPESKGQWQLGQLNQIVCEGSRVRVEANSRASLLLTNGIVLRLDQGTVLSLNGLAPYKPTLLDLFKGYIHFISRTPSQLEITTPIANAGPEGTEFAMRVDDNSASLWVYEGAVKFFNDKGSVRLSPGQGAQAHKGQAPQAQINIKPQDAVNWALYYPPLLPYPDAKTMIDSDIRTAIRDFRQGRVDVALASLDGLSPGQQTPYFYKVRGAMRLTVGQDKLALQDIHALLANKPNDAEALALQSVLALTQNRKDEAYDLANQAIAANSQSASAYSALSYAEQGRFQLEKAQAAADQAVKLAPHDAMLWARKAELELSQGLTSQSKQTAQKASELDATLERTQTVMGFSYLLRMDTDEALQSFEKAIKLDSTSPLARLGLGLAKIRDGDLAEGRQDLEIAAILDPNNSLIRSYLGKAYYEEKRSSLAEDQFGLAKERDPKDPTPYFYDALKKQTENRPVEALQDLQKAMALNDNRAVYRSKQLLDADRAARGASLARIYDNLGFEQRGAVEAASSLQLDPTNFSAHRFLSDTYVSQPGRETAQLSELLQAKMLQPININPVQPHLSVSQRGLLNASGIANSSFQDFTRVFEGNRPQLLVSGVAGNQGILGDEVVLSGIYNKFSYSLGQYHNQSDGIKKDKDELELNKNKILHDIYDVFLQANIIKNFDVQFEYINRQTYLSNTNQKIPGSVNDNSIRTGFHWQLSEADHILGLYTHKIYSQNDFHIVNSDDPETPDFKDNFMFNSNNLEVQHIKKTNLINITSGFSYYGLSDVNTQYIEGGKKNSEKEPIQDGFNIYMYTILRMIDQLNLVAGFSYDKYDPDVNNTKNLSYDSKWNPKFGIQWDMFKHAKLRAAYFTGYKKPYLVSQSIEPTQIAGFNQQFDDINNRAYEFYGAALDLSWPQFFFGTEASHRNVFDNKNVKESFTDSLKS